MLKQPDFEYPTTDGKSHVCTADGQYHAYLDLDAARLLLHDLYWFYDQQPGEEIEISSNWDEAPKRGKRIGYCEFNMTPGHVHKKQGKNILKTAQTVVRHKPHGVYSPENDRLDFFVSPEEIELAYEALTLLVQSSQERRSPRAAMVFGTLTIHLALP